MRIFPRYILLLVVLLYGVFTFSQDKQWQDMHKVKRSETIFGIAKKYGITVEELIDANPDMNTPGYELKKGDYIFIPYAKAKSSTNKKAQDKKSTITNKKAVKVGVVLPLHNIDGDGRRMTEYYRGLLMACNDLKRLGISVDIKACNMPIDGNIYQLLYQNDLSDRDVIFGPLYTKQVKPLADFAKSHNIKLVIPFSINGNDVISNKEIFQVYQSPAFFYNEVARHFSYRFSNYNVVIVDCNDKTSDKGVFTSALRRTLEQRGSNYNITNVSSSSEMFAKAFSHTKPNMVVLNTARSPELTKVIEKLDELKASSPSLALSLFGYTEWLMYVKYNKEKFFNYDTYIPTCSFYNQYSTKVKLLENKYLSWFKSDMQDYLPRFAITGYDHAMFFIRGINKEGAKFNGSNADSDALQVPLRFSRTASGGGYQNTAFMFVHFNRNKSISTINF